MNTLALSLVTLVLSFGSVDEALHALEKGQQIRHEVEWLVAVEAAERIHSGTTPAKVEALARVALAGGAETLLAQALVPLVCAQVPGSDAATRLLAELSPAAVAVATSPRPPGWTEGLAEVADESDDRVAARGAIDLLAGHASPMLVAQLVSKWCEEPNRGWRAWHLLRLSGERGRAPATLYRRLVHAELPQVWGPCLGDTLTDLLSRNPKTYRRAVFATREDSAPALRSLGALPPQHWRLARRYVLGVALDPDAPPDLLVAAIGAGTELRLDALLPELPRLASKGEDPAVRRVATLALGELGARDRPTVDLLLELLADEDVALQAHRSLIRKAGISLPLRLESWRAWRAQVSLPEADPLQDTLRLKSERHALALLIGQGRRPPRLRHPPPRFVPQEAAPLPPPPQTTPSAQEESLDIPVLGIFSFGFMLLSLLLNAMPMERRRTILPKTAFANPARNRTDPELQKAEELSTLQTIKDLSTLIEDDMGGARHLVAESRRAQRLEPLAATTRRQRRRRLGRVTTPAPTPRRPSGRRIRVRPSRRIRRMIDDAWKEESGSGLYDALL